MIRLPRISNGTDVEALAVEPGVSVRLVTDPARLVDADLVVIPGSKSTVADLEWLRRTGLADAIAAHAEAGRPILGICGGFQQLSKSIVDKVESRTGAVPGLGLVDVDIEFAPAKTLATPTGTVFGAAARGYEIHHGQVVRRDAALPGLIELADGSVEGVLSGSVAGTHWHGLLENDQVRRALLRWAASTAGRDGFVPAPDVSFQDARDAQFDLIADLIEANLDTDAVLRLIEHGAPADLPVLPPGAP